MKKLKYKMVEVPVFYENLWDYSISKRFKVSVCILTHKRVEALKNTLWSILRQETDFEYEIIIVDDASIDGTEKFIMDEYSDLIHSRKMKYVKICTRLGIYKTLFIASSIADGEIVIINGGEIIQPYKNTMQRLVDELDNNTIATFPRGCVKTGSAEELNKMGWKTNPEKLDRKNKNHYSHPPLFTLGAMRWKDFKSMTMWRHPNPDTYIARWFHLLKKKNNEHLDSLKIKNVRFKILDDIVGMHQTHESYTSWEGKSNWYKKGTDPP